ncbi:MAG TPA: GHMP kinase [Syntrophomonadaceae bacterium]|nr:GHMP kinase [Syntrophomonadaceae bacterium]
MVILKGSAVVPGSCGELVQGTSGGTNFLVSCPVNWYSRVTVRLGASQEDVYPKNRLKTYLAVRKMLDVYGYSDRKVVLEVTSSLPVSKGMASSTADLAAGCFAAAAAVKIKPDPQEIARIALAVEPSDATFFPGIALFDHVQGMLYQELGNAVPLGIIALDFGGVVDTLTFNNRGDLPSWNKANECKTGQALELVKAGINKADPALIGRGATLSALTNQGLLHKPCLEELIDYALSHGAYGVNVAHSGTVAGVLVPPGRESDASLVSGIIKHFPAIGTYYPLRLVGGGPRYPGMIHRRDGEYSEAPAWG